MRHASLMFIGMLALAVVGRAQANLSFSAQSTALAYDFRACTSADIVGSSLPDLITIDRAAAALKIHDPQTPAATIAVPLGGAPLGLLVGNLDQDADLDAVTVNGTAFEAAGGSISICRQTAPGVFAVQTLAVPYAARLSVRDMDQDGDPDIVCGLTILTNDGLGGFTIQPPIPTSSTVKTWIPGDFDGDGDADLAASYTATVNSVSGNVGRMFRRDAGGAWTLLAPFMIAPDAPMGAITVSDTSGDGIEDLAYFTGTQMTATTPASRIGTIVGGTGFGTVFTPAFSACISSYTGRVAMTAADISGDGLPDLVTNLDGLVPFVFINNGSGAFSPAGGPLFPYYANGVQGEPVVRDFDQDGLADIIIGDGVLGSTAEPSAVVLFRNLGTPGTAQMPGFAPVSAVTVTGESAFGLSFSTIQPNGTPAIGQFISLSITPITSTPYAFGCSFTQATGIVNSFWSTAYFSFAGATPGQFIATATLPSGATTSILVTVVSQLADAGGSNQAAAAGSDFTLPLAVHHTTLPLGGSTGPVTWTSTGAVPVTFGGAATAATTLSASGDSSVTVRAGTTAGQAAVTATLAYVSVTFPLTVLPGNQLVAGGDGQLAASFETFAAPITIHLENGLAQPIANSPVVFSVTSGTCTTSAPLVATDAQGNAHLNVTAADPAVYRGPITIRAITENGGRDFHLFAHGLRVLAPNASTRTFHLVLPHAGVPLLLMVDQPLPSPGYVNSIFGRLYTSVLSPLPTYGYLDGMGIYGPADPTLITNASGVWFRFFANLPPLGLTFTAQFAGYDINYAFPQTVVLSNAVTFSL